MIPATEANRTESSRGRQEVEQEDHRDRRADGFRQA